MNGKFGLCVNCELKTPVAFCALLSRCKLGTRAFLFWLCLLEYLMNCVLTLTMPIIVFVTHDSHDTYSRHLDVRVVQMNEN